MTLYSTLEATGETVEIAPGRAFVTHWLTVEDAAESARSGVAIGDPAPYEANHPWNALDRYGPADLARYLITASDL